MIAVTDAIEKEPIYKPDRTLYNILLEEKNGKQLTKNDIKKLKKNL